MRLKWGGCHWRLLPQRAAYIEDLRTLVVADAHFGKAATFRAHGMPIPRGTTDENLARLTGVIRDCDPVRLVFLGDLFHAREAHAQRAVAAMAAWRGQHAAVDMVLVEGNHDLKAGPPPAALGLCVEGEPWRDGGLAFCHHPLAIEGRIAVAGHLHPCVRLVSRAESLRLACFWLQRDTFILPAFGEFTGGTSIARTPGDRVIAIADGRLFEVPAINPEV
jgi:uncharacterized protein